MLVARVSVFAMGLRVHTLKSRHVDLGRNNFDHIILD